MKGAVFARRQECLGCESQVVEGERLFLGWCVPAAHLGRLGTRGRQGTLAPISLVCGRGWGPQGGQAAEGVLGFTARCSPGTPVVCRVV